MDISQLIRKGSLVDKYLGLIIAVGIVLFLFILNIVLTPNDLDDGIEYLEEGQYDLALQSFNKVKIRNDNWSEVSQGIMISKAGLAFSERRWTEVLSNLNGTEPIQIYRSFYFLFRDSAQNQIDEDSLRLVIPRLKYSVFEKKDLGATFDILVYIGNNSRIQEKVKSRYPFGQILVDYSLRIAENMKQLHAKTEELYTSTEELKSKALGLKERLDEAEQQGIRWRSFMIEKQFDMDHSGDVPRPMYSGVSMSEQSEIVVIANEGEVPNSVYERMSVRLLVKAVGNKEYTKSNMYGYSTTVYLPTFETVDKDQDPARIRKEGLKIVELTRTLHEAGKKVRESILDERSHILTDAVDELKTTNWQ